MSFCSSNYGRYEFLHYNKQLFYEIAYNIGQSLHNLAFPDNKNYKKVIEDIEFRKKQGSFDKFSNTQVDDSDDDEIKEKELEKAKRDKEIVHNIFTKRKEQLEGYKKKY